MGKIVNALTFAAGFAAASTAQADGFPNPFCTVDDKGGATVYSRVEAGEFRPEVRSKGAVKREVGWGEQAQSAWSNWRNNTNKPIVATPVPGLSETYRATTDMYVVGARKGLNWVEEYGGGITVNISNWRLNEPKGTCVIGSTVSGEGGETMPIQSLKRMPRLNLE